MVAKDDEGEDVRSRKMVERSSGGSLLMGTLVVLCARLASTASDARMVSELLDLSVDVDGGDLRFNFDRDLRAILCVCVGGMIVVEPWPAGVGRGL